MQRQTVFPKHAIFVAYALLTMLLGARAVPSEPLPRVATLDLGTLDPEVFADEELDLPYYVAHLPRVANSLVESGPYRGWISLHIWRNTNDPISPTIGDNVLSFLYFYCLDRPWNPYYNDPVLKQRTEIAMEYWCRMYDEAYWRTSPTGHQTQMNSKYLGGAMQLLQKIDQDGLPFDATVADYASDVHREGLRRLLSDTALFQNRKAYTNQYSSVWGDAAAHLHLHPEDTEIESLFRQRVQESMDLYQSPAGFFYEANGPDWRYDTLTHQSNLRMAWFYCRQAGLTDLVDMFEEKYTRWFDWASYNLVREPDGSWFYLNRAVECRQKTAVVSFLELPAGVNVENARAFSLDQATFQDKLRQRRAEMEAAWPEVDELVIGKGNAFTPYEFLHRPETQWFPTEQQHADAVAKLPYMERDHFIHQRMDNRVSTVFTYVRKPGYYAIFNSGSKAVSQQRLGLSLLWNDVTGTVLQSQTDSNTAAWGTKAGGASQVYEANPLNVVFYVDDQQVVPAVGNRDLDEGTLKISYSLGTSGQKSLTFDEDSIEVMIIHSGTFTEHIPLVIGAEDEVLIEGSQATLVRPEGSLVITASESTEFQLTTTEFTANPELQDVDTGAYSVTGYSEFYAMSSVLDGRGPKDILSLVLTATGSLYYRMTWIIPEPALPGDLNQDGFVGGDDLDIIRDFWGQNVTRGDLSQGDPSSDGFVGGDDLDIVRAHWGQGTPPVPRSVPEPSTFMAFAGVVAGIFMLYPRRRY